MTHIAHAEALQGATANLNLNGEVRMTNGQKFASGRSFNLRIVRWQAKAPEDWRTPRRCASATRRRQAQFPKIHKLSQNFPRFPSTFEKNKNVMSVKSDRIQFDQIRLNSTTFFNRKTGKICEKANESRKNRSNWRSNWDPNTSGQLRCRIYDALQLKDTMGSSSSSPSLRLSPRWAGREGIYIASWIFWVNPAQFSRNSNFGKRPMKSPMPDGP